MFDKDGQWIHLETFDDFDNGLSDLIELWSSTSAAATMAIGVTSYRSTSNELESTIDRSLSEAARRMTWFSPMVAMLLVRTS